MFGTRHPVVFIAFLLAMLALSPKAGSAQANEAPIPDAPTLSWPTLGWPEPKWTTPDGTPIINGSNVAPTSNPWSETPGASSGPTSGFTPACAGIACLTAAEKSELNELCKLTGAKWQDYGLCQKIAISLLTPQP